MNDTAPESLPVAESTPPRKSWPAVLTLGALIAVVSGGYAFYVSRHPVEMTPPVAQAQPNILQSPKALDPELSAADAEKEVRTFLKALSPKLAALLTGPELLRRVVGAVQLAADGESWLHLFPELRPAKAFEVTQRGKKLFIDPKSYLRYSELTAAITAVDAQAAGRAYRKLRPIFAQVFSEIAPPGASFDDALLRVLASVENAKLIDGDVELLPRGLVYQFKDPALEAASPTQKLLLRLGPSNARALQAQAHAFSEAINE